MLASYLPRFRRARRTMDAMKLRESWDRSRIEAFQLRRLNELWASSVRSVPYYRRLYAENALPSSFDSLAEFVSSVPHLDKEKVRSVPGEFVSRDRHKGSWHRTGGSTGVPMRVYWSHAAHREMLCCKYLQARDFGVDIFDRTVFLWGHAESFAPGFRGIVERTVRPAIDKLRNRLRLSAYRLDATACSQYLANIRRFRPKLIYAYSSALDQLARHNDKSTFDSLRLCVVTAEPAPEATVERIEASFGVRCVIEYGSVECGIIASQGADRKLRVREDVCIVETREVQGSFELLVTVLNNPAFPLIRYAIGDHTSQAISPTTKGFRWLRDVIGRNNDFLVSTRGKLIHPNAVKHVVEADGVGRFRCHQKLDGRLVVLLEQHSSISTDVQKRWIGQLSDLLEGYPVEIEFVTRLLPNRAGKHRYIVTDLETDLIPNVRLDQRR